MIIEKYYTKLTLDFDTNKRIMDEVALIPSKPLKNKVSLFIIFSFKAESKLIEGLWDHICFSITIKTGSWMYYIYDTLYDYMNNCLKVMFHFESQKKKKKYLSIYWSVFSSAISFYPGRLSLHHIRKWPCSRKWNMPVTHNTFITWTIFVWYLVRHN